MPTKEQPRVTVTAKRLPKGERGGVELLLVHNVEHLGKQGDVVEVKRGYAYNYLLPQGLATVATEHHKRMVEKHRAKLEEIARERLAGLRSLLAELVRPVSRSRPTRTTRGICTAPSAGPKSPGRSSNRTSPSTPTRSSSKGRSRRWGCIRFASGWHPRSKAI
jgi:hypothetical protein